MARFRGTLDGKSRTQASRLGAATTGLSGSVNGWDCGVYVVARADGDKDNFEIYVTGGSNGGKRIHLASVTDGKIRIVYNAVNQEG